MGLKKKKSTKHTSCRRRYMSLTPNDRHDLSSMDDRMRIVGLMYGLDRRGWNLFTTGGAEQNEERYWVYSWWSCIPASFAEEI